MPAVAVVPACALVAGVSVGILLAQPVPYLALLLAGLWAAAVAAWSAERRTAAVVCATLGYACAGVALGSREAAAALAPSIRTVLDREVGGFALASAGPGGAHQPFVIRARLEEDAVVPPRASPGGRDEAVAMRVRVEAVWISGTPHAVDGGVRLSIGGATAAHRAREWRAGRRIVLPVIFRRPARYFNDGIADFERGLALDGIALHAGAKSALLVDVVARGSAIEEWCAGVRALVRERVARRVGSRDPLAGGIVTAILIGDRTGLPDEVRARLQAAGTYHVIAISGGNIAILAALLTAVLFVAGLTGRWATLAIVAGVVAYAAIVNAGPSVWRATATAVAYLVARAIDHRTPPWNAMAVSAALLACAAPLDVRDAGFALTFGATAAIVEAAARVPRPVFNSPLSGRVVSWLLASLAASAAAEIVLLPIAASVFLRVTCAGLVLNLVAVPLMTLSQVAGLLVVAGGQVDTVGQAAGSVAAWAARALVESARLIDLLPWLAVRVPEPSLFVVALYYATLAGAWWPGRATPEAAASRRTRQHACAAAVTVCAILILTGATPRVRARADDRALRMTIFDVGQGEAILLQAPGRRTLMIDAGGVGFDGAAFDIGGRVLTPVLWAHGVGRLDVLAVTHGDPDHIGGTAAIVRDLRPRELWLGVPVPRDEADRSLRVTAVEQGIRVVPRQSGQVLQSGEVTIRLLHPPAPDWERQRVRNDDSLVMEVRYRDVAILLTGDVSAEVERAIAPRLTAARTRILKVAHHGSRTSTSQALLDAWQPDIAVISCGRGNRFGHPAPEVMARLRMSGVKVYRTDRDGQITIDSNGRDVEVRTLMAASSPAATLPPSARARSR